MGFEDDNSGDRAENFKDVVVVVRVFSDEVPIEVVRAIIKNDMNEVVYKVDDNEYHFVVLDISEVGDIMKTMVH